MSGIVGRLGAVLTVAVLCLIGALPASSQTAKLDLMGPYENVGAEPAGDFSQEVEEYS